MNSIKYFLIAAAAAAVIILCGCGGGFGSDSQEAQIVGPKIFGPDSLRRR